MAYSIVMSGASDTAVNVSEVRSARNLAAVKLSRSHIEKKGVAARIGVYRRHTETGARALTFFNNNVHTSTGAAATLQSMITHLWNPRYGMIDLGRVVKSCMSFRPHLKPLHSFYWCTDFRTLKLVIAAIDRCSRIATTSFVCQRHPCWQEVTQKLAKPMRVLCICGK